MRRSAKAFLFPGLLGGVRETISCGVSLGIQSSIPELLSIIERELAAGYQRIKLKCKPGWDVEVFDRVRNRWPGILLSCDANSAYRLRDQGHIWSFDAFDLLMIEQPLWHDDFYFHSVLQKRLNTPICLDESIRNRRDALAAIEMESCKIINIKLGRVGGFSEAIAVHNAALERGIPVWCGGMLESGIGRSHNIALSTLEGFTLPGDVSASARYFAEDIIEPEVTVSAEGEIAIPDTPGRGYEVRSRSDRKAHRAQGNHPRPGAGGIGIWKLDCGSAWSGPGRTATSIPWSAPILSPEPFPPCAYSFSGREPPRRLYTQRLNFRSNRMNRLLCRIALWD